MRSALLIAALSGGVFFLPHPVDAEPASVQGATAAVIAQSICPAGTVSREYVGGLIMQVSLEANMPLEEAADVIGWMAAMNIEKVEASAGRDRFCDEMAALDWGF